jgi:hypothetical protein
MTNLCGLHLLCLGVRHGNRQPPGSITIMLAGVTTGMRNAAAAATSAAAASGEDEQRQAHRPGGDSPAMDEV